MSVATREQEDCEHFRAWQIRKIFDIVFVCGPRLALVLSLAGGWEQPYNAVFQAAEAGSCQLYRASTEANAASVVSLFLLEKLQHHWNR